MRRYSSPEKRYVTLGLPSFAGTASITDSAVVIMLRLSSGKPIYVLNHQPTLGRFLHADDGHVGALLGMSTKVVGSPGVPCLRARPRRGGPYAIPMGLATDPLCRLQDSPKFATMNFRSVSSVTARLTPSLPIPLTFTPPNEAFS